MYSYAPKSQKTHGKATPQHTATSRSLTNVRPFSAENRPDPVQMKRPRQAASDNPPARQLRVFPEMASTDDPTGLPSSLKAGIENLSGFAMDDVRVHYNSPRPAQLRALAYTQGNDIHVGIGQEKHLAHEAWHVAQQKQGRVKPTLRLAGTQINDDAALEHEAEVMATKAFLGRPDRALTGPAAHKATSDTGEKKDVKVAPQSEAAATGAAVERARLNPSSTGNRSSPPSTQGSEAGVIQRTIGGKGSSSWYRDDQTSKWLFGLSSERHAKARELLGHDSDHSYEDVAQQLGISADDIPRIATAPPVAVAAPAPKADVLRPTDEMPDKLRGANITFTKSSATKHGHSKDYIRNSIRNLSDLKDIRGGYESTRSGYHTYTIRHPGAKDFQASNVTFDYDHKTGHLRVFHSGPGG